ncbi:Sec63 Brl domain-containing protein [Halteromyces radiatus]|uniref:Sec63 Brl domain-containing protein n=1 Tax=Halteromyces radiatus TaxID=101107 RepID=UPI00221E488A|nr:Sec63 Brl domain-containing protein [Halteromyces radiatus]KAI8099039.1 Sec63 Brl domain-containing protein [Halteromyces radiatus]
MDLDINNWMEQEEAFLDQFNPQIQFMSNSPSSSIIMNTPTMTKTNPLQRSIMEIPEMYRSIFKYPYFNRMQSEAMDKVLYTDENIVISAPTGTGKTALLEMAMIRCLTLQKSHYHEQSTAKMVYMAPTKSLCAEKVKEWTTTFGPLGIICQEFTGDSDYATADAIKNSNIMQIDEIHILKDPRGATLEVCVSRMKPMDHNLRFVAVSATVPNVQDITTWLNATALTFSEDYRPIRLERFVYGYPLRGGNTFAFEKSLDWKLLDIINKHSANKPVLIFCSTRASTQSACDTLLKLMDQQGMDSRCTSPGINTNVKNKKLALFVQRGIGFHHAGLDSSDRHLVESLFSDRYIRIVATTSTLAVGVNLPAHLVIIKSTKGYQSGMLKEYTDIDILQMIGRAGRPGLDTSGCAVIMTTSDMENKCKLLVSYLCINNMNLLVHHGLVNVTGEGSTASHSATYYGRTMDRYYIHLKTMVLIMKPRDWNSVKDVLELVSQAEEFETNRYSANEKSVLNHLRNNSDVRFPLKNKLACISDKVCLVIQCILGDISLYHPTAGNTLTTEGYDILRKASRITKCKSKSIIDCAGYEKNSLKLKHAIDLYQSLQAKMWSTSPFILRQIEGIGTQIAKTLSQKNICNFDQLRDCDPGRLELILHRNPPFGTKIKSALSSIPHVHLYLQQKSNRNYQGQYPTIELSVKIESINRLQVNKTIKFGKGFYTILWIETSTHVLIDFRRIPTQQLMTRPYELSFQVQVTSPSMMVLCHVQSEDYVGVDVMSQLKPDVDPTQFITLTGTPLAMTTSVSAATQSTIKDDTDSFGDDDDDIGSDVWQRLVDVLDYEESKTKEVKIQSISSEHTKPSSTQYQCKHQCKDKQRCKHPCCKRGLFQPDQHKITTMMGNCSSSNILNKDDLSMSGLDEDTKVGIKRETPILISSRTPPPPIVATTITSHSGIVDTLNDTKHDVMGNSTLQKQATNISTDNDSWILNDDSFIGDVLSYKAKCDPVHNNSTHPGNNNNNDDDDDNSFSFLDDNLSFITDDLYGGKPPLMEVDPIDWLWHDLGKLISDPYYGAMEQDNNEDDSLIDLTELPPIEEEQPSPKSTTHFEIWIQHTATLTKT